MPDVFMKFSKRVYVQDSKSGGDMGASELRFRSGPSLPQADECQTHHLKVSAQLLLLCVSSLTEWQTQDSLALKKILSAKIPKEKELAATPTLFSFPKA